MKKLFLVVTMLVACLGLAQTPPPVPYAPVGGLCDMGANAAASLLIPYFEVDKTADNSMDTYVGIINLSPDPIVAHVNVWNVDSIVIFDFNIYLTGYDVVTFSMRQILVNGLLPNNGCIDAADRFTDAYIDCDGDSAYFGTTFADPGMFGTPSYHMDIACYDTQSATTLADWACKLSEGSYLLYNGDTTGQLPMPDYVAGNLVGYITIDASITCSGAMLDTNPDSYMGPNVLDTNADGVPDHSIIENSNILMADMFYYDNKNAQADGMPAVHVEAFGEANGLIGHTWGMQPIDFSTTYGINTFYNKFEDNVGVAPFDCREQLPLWWAFRYITNVAFDGGTWVDVWRSHNSWWDHWIVTVGGTGPCNWGGTAGYSFLGDLFTGQYGLVRPAIIAFDEEENTGEGGGGVSPPPLGGIFDMLFLETQRVQVRTPEFPLIGESGWIGLSFMTDYLRFGTGFGNAFDQSWVNVRYTANNKYSVGLSAISYLNGCALVWNGTAFVPTPTH